LIHRRTPPAGLTSAHRKTGLNRCWCTGVYREIALPEPIVYTLAIADEKVNLESLAKA